MDISALSVLVKSERVDSVKGVTHSARANLFFVVGILNDNAGQYVTHYSASIAVK